MFLKHYNKPQKFCFHLLGFIIIANFSNQPELADGVIIAVRQERCNERHF